MKQTATTPPLCWEDAAEVVTVTGWACKRCHRFWGEGPSGERAARFCCHTDRACEVPGCANRVKNHAFSICPECHRAQEDERWASLPRVNWDGKTPMCALGGGDETYLWDHADLKYYFDDPAHTPEAARLVVCEPDNGCEFEMAEFLADHLPDDGDTESLDDTEAIDKIVNAWIAEHAPYCWRPTDVAVTAESIRAALVTRPAGSEEK